MSQQFFLRRPNSKQPSLGETLADGAFDSFINTHQDQTAGSVLVNNAWRNEVVISTATALLQFTPIHGGEFYIGYDDAVYNKAMYEFPKTQQTYTGHSIQLRGATRLSRSVLLFEFRDLYEVKTSGFEDFMTKVDSAIQKLHKDFADPPKKRKRDVPANCTMPGTPAPSSSTEPYPVVVDPVDPPSQPTCVPNPTSDVKDAHEEQTKKAAKYFCNKHASDTNAKGPIDIVHTIIAGTRPMGR
ncbi:MAG: hypothetical protein Q9217_003624 [Psora testacea]